MIGIQSQPTPLHVAETKWLVTEWYELLLLNYHPLNELANFHYIYLLRKLYGLLQKHSKKTEV